MVSKNLMYSKILFITRVNVRNMRLFVLGTVEFEPFEMLK